uniref:Uncharacterized protein n=1 Tax=Neobodo designis TaxID=312471 RepID=A0A7S1QAE9_NEODS|mmetsp:Transcript_39112/g.120880  ORF Transcript_39112/g.120880 Transcript_39112/m.120880 type:complete len:344 (+) Transcript_39112:83-1114(+)
MPPKRTIAVPHRAAAPASDASPAPNSSGGQPPLCGRYKEFFEPQHHPAVSKFYHQDAGHKLRQNFKRLVKAISHFDVEATKRKLRTGFDLDIPTANAIVANNGGPIMTPEAREKAVLYVAAAQPAERQAFRETFGLIVPPSLTCLHQSKLKMDFAEDRKFMKGELMHRDTSKPVVAKSQLHPRSAPIEAPCEVIGEGRSQYGMFFAWKVAPKLGTNVTQRAHSSSYNGAPWGQYGSSEKSRWKSHAVEDAEDRDYGAPTTTLETTTAGATLAQTRMPKRRFQNYNDNVTHEMYRTQRLLRKGRHLPGETHVAIDQAARAAPDLLRPERAPVHAGERYSPIFCR